MATVTFSGATTDQIAKAIAAKMAKRLEVATFLLANEMKAELSAHDNLKGSHDSGESAGTVPFKVTGRLAGSIRRNVDKENLTAKVGSNVLYSKYLQRGTRWMLARPWISIVYNKCKQQLDKIIGGNK